MTPHHLQTRSLRHLRLVLGFLALNLALAPQSFASGFPTTALREIGADPFLPSAGIRLETYDLDHLAAVSSLFDRIDYDWPLTPNDRVPRITLKSLPRDLGKDPDVRHRKAIFFRTLLPIVLAENRLLGAQRAYIQRLLENGLPRPGSADFAHLQEQIEHYKLKGSPDDPRVVARLLTHIDEAPVGMVLAQAANESAWGTSRFARLANNLFGIWTYKQGEGILPKRRAPGQKHLIRRYDSIRDSVRSYLYNINTGHAYKQLRKLRADMRAKGQGLDSLRLAAGLSRYSERGAAYVREIRSMIRVNHLNDLQDLEFRPGPVRQALLEQ